MVAALLNNRKSPPPLPTHLADLRQALPFRLGGVKPRGVVARGVEEHDAAGGGGGDVGEHAVEVEGEGGRVVVAVGADVADLLWVWCGCGCGGGGVLEQIDKINHERYQQAGKENQ